MLVADSLIRCVFQNLFQRRRFTCHVQENALARRCVLQFVKKKPC